MWDYNLILQTELLQDEICLENFILCVWPNRSHRSGFHLQQQDRERS